MVVARTGWTFEVAGALPLPRLWQLMRHWNKEPPVDVLVAAFLGYDPSPQKKAVNFEKLTGIMGKPSPEAALPRAIREKVRSHKADPKYLALLERMKVGGRAN